MIHNIYFMLCLVVGIANAYNQYIIALVLPDVFFSGCCMVTCALNWLASTYYGGTSWCAWQSFYVVFGFSGSIWMQVVIASEIQAMVHAVHQERPYVLGNCGPDLQGLVLGLINVD